ncbi:MAG: TfoX/Sxy family protein [Phenylobacterium sp.]
MAVSARFLDAVRDVLGFVPDLRLKRMFGGAGVYSGDLMFALAIDDGLYLKADAESEGAFAALGLEPFLYRGRTGEPRPMSYRQAPDAVWEDEDVAREWASRALGAAGRKRR